MREREMGTNKKSMTGVRKRDLNSQAFKINNLNKHYFIKKTKTQPTFCNLLKYSYTAINIIYLMKG